MFHEWFLWFALSEAVAEDRYPELPPLSALQRFPGEQECAWQVKAWWEWRDWYKRARPYQPWQIQQLHDRASFRCWETERLWDLLGECYSDTRSEEQRRESLYQLRRQLGPERWERGEMPGRLLPWQCVPRVRIEDG